MAQTVGMRQQCTSIRSNSAPGERCGNRSLEGLEWCGKHKHTQRRFSPPAEPASTLSIQTVAARSIQRIWRRHLLRTAGPLVWAREESNNPYDFYSGEDVRDIPLSKFVSFVEAGKGYCMDRTSAVSLLEHADQSNEPATNPFTRAVIPVHVIHRILRYTPPDIDRPAITKLAPMNDAQQLTFQVTDIFQHINDLGYYTDPSWLLDMDLVTLKRLYIEMKFAWFYSGLVPQSQRNRIIPDQTSRSQLFVPSVVECLDMESREDVMRYVLSGCRLLTASAESRSDQQTGVMCALSGFVLLNERCAEAYPWIHEMVAPGITRVLDTRIRIRLPQGV